MGNYPLIKLLTGDGDVFTILLLPKENMEGYLSYAVFFHQIPGYTPG
jgi:hypothetical protein